VVAGRPWDGQPPSRSATRQRHKKERIGYDFVHSLVDDHTRLAYSEVLDDEKGATCAAFLLRAADYFAAHGIAAIETLMTDNAMSYRLAEAMKAAVTDLGVKHIFIKPHCPWQNGKVERYNRTLQVEWAYRQLFTSNQARTAALAPWLDHYNTERRHSALGGLPPISRLSPT
jgi:transposase InsO family protein